MAVNLDEFSELFDTFEQSAFRLETLQLYSIPEESDLVADFLAGRPLPAWTPDNHELMRQIAEDTASGKRWQRVHVVDEPWTDYVRYELAVYRYGVAAGEDIRIVRRNAPDVDALREDFWAFDLDDPRQARVVIMRYDEKGRFLGPEQADDVSEYTRRRDVALAASIPLERYLAGRELQRRKAFPVDRSA